MIEIIGGVGVKPAPFFFRSEADALRLSSIALGRRHG